MWPNLVLTVPKPLKVYVLLLVVNTEGPAFTWTSSSNSIRTECGNHCESLIKCQPTMRTSPFGPSHRPMLLAHFCSKTVYMLWHEATQCSRSHAWNVFKDAQVEECRPLCSSADDQSVTPPVLPAGASGFLVVAKGRRCS